MRAINSVSYTGKRMVCYCVKVDEDIIFSVTVHWPMQAKLPIFWYLLDFLSLYGNINTAFGLANMSRSNL